MGRKPRIESSTGVYHVILRGNNKKWLFHTAGDFQQLLEYLSKYLQKTELKLYHYCLMSNHAHLLLWSPDKKGLGAFMHGVERSYHHYYRKTYSFFGHLFQGRYRSFSIEKDEYLLDCGRYIERNPVRAKLIERPEAWAYSSYRFYALGEADTLVTPSPAYLGLSKEMKEREKLYRMRVESTRPYEEILDNQLIGL